jgi:DNA modification methylase
VQTDSIDIVITSPPYLNAIDYVRCSKFTLVWLGHSVSDLRQLRSTNVGAEGSRCDSSHGKLILDICDCLDPDGQLIMRHRAIISRYIHDMRSVADETARVLRPGGKAVIVIGNSTVGGHFVRNSLALRLLFDAAGLDHTRSISRELPPTRRYLPPPRRTRHKNALHARMREEVVMTFRKVA